MLAVGLASSASSSAHTSATHSAAAALTVVGRGNGAVQLLDNAGDHGGIGGFELLYTLQILIIGVEGGGIILHICGDFRCQLIHLGVEFRFRKEAFTDFLQNSVVALLVFIHRQQLGDQRPLGNSALSRFVDEHRSG
ncbi:hypothetical protein D3C75_870300 [compost metagenome]